MVTLTADYDPAYARLSDEQLAALMRAYETPFLQVTGTIDLLAMRERYEDWQFSHYVSLAREQRRRFRQRKEAA